MEKMIVMDYSDHSINIYENPAEDKSVMELLKEYGHNVEDCFTMFCDTFSINYK